MPVSSINGPTKHHRTADSVKLKQFELKEERKQAKKHQADPPAADELLLSPQGRKLGHVWTDSNPSPKPKAETVTNPVTDQGKKLGHVWTDSNPSPKPKAEPDTNPVTDPTPEPDKDPVVNDPVVNDPVVNDPVVNDPVVNDPVVNDPVINDPSGTGVTVSTPDLPGTSSGSNTTVPVVSADLTALLDRLEALTKRQNELSNAVASFEQLALDFEGRFSRFEQGDGPVIRGQLQIEGLSLNNINIALKFARRGFDVLSLLQSTAGPQHSNGLKNISESLNRGLEALKSQTKYLAKNVFAEQTSWAELFSNNLGAALNQTV